MSEEEFNVFINESFRGEVRIPTPNEDGYIKFETTENYEV